MVVQEELADDDVNRIFRALADATRRDIVRRTLVDEVSVSQLADSVRHVVRGSAEARRRAGGGETRDQRTARP